MAALSPRLAAQEHLLHLRCADGLIRAAAVTGGMDDPPTAETIDALFTDPLAAQLAELCLSHPINVTRPLWPALLAMPRPSIVQLTIDELGDGGAQLDRLPNLESLVLHHYLGSDQPWCGSAAPVTALAHPRLRHLDAYFEACPAVSSGAFDLPALASLTWRVHRDLRPDHFQTPPSVDLFTNSASILHRPPATLDTLTLFTMFVQIEPLERLEACALLPQLRTLRIRDSHFFDLLPELVERAASFRHLEVFAGVGQGTLPRIEIEVMRGELERALPQTRIEIDWESLVERPRDIHVETHPRRR